MKIKNLISAFLLLIVLFGGHLALAQTYNFKTDSGLDKTASQAGYSDYLKNLTPEKVVSKVVSQVLTFLGVVFLGLMIYGGITWMLATGNEAKVDLAKNIITAGVIGLVIVMAAYAISYFVIEFFSAKTL